MSYNYEHCKLLRTVDGDTIDLEIDTGFKNKHTDRFRLLGMDTPELPTLDGKSAKARLEVLLTNKVITVTTFKADSFGRWLCVVYADGENINQRMIDEGFAIKK